MTEYAWQDMGDGRSVFRPVAAPPPKRSALSAPHIVSDTMPETQSMATGKFHTSKSGLRAEYKRLGKTELGNDPARLRPKPRQAPDRKGINEAVGKAVARFKRGERTRPQ